jgi:hypothetical protein
MQSIQLEEIAHTTGRDAGLEDMVTWKKLVWKKLAWKKCSPGR